MKQLAISNPGESSRKMRAFVSPCFVGRASLDVSLRRLSAYLGALAFLPRCLSRPRCVQSAMPLLPAPPGLLWVSVSVGVSVGVSAGVSVGVGV